MATGGGGAYPHHIAEAFVTLGWKDKAYYDGLRRAEKALYDFGVKANRLGATLGGGMGTAATGINAARRAMIRLTNELIAANRQATRLAATLGSLGGGGTIRALGGARAGSIRAFGTAAGSFASGLGRALGSTLAGFGRGLGNVLSGAGGGGGSFVRSGMSGFGKMFRDIASGFGTALTSVVRNSTSLLRSLVSTLMTPLRLAGRLARVGGLLGGIGGGLTAGAAIYGGVRTATSMESQLATLRRITGASPGEMGSLSGTINRAAGRTPGVGLNRFYEVAETGARMGIPTEQLATFANGMARLGIVLDENELPLQDAANRIGSLISVFGLSANAAEKFGSALVKLDQMSTASARDIIDIAARFSGPAAAFGMKPQESLALATALRQARVPVETAGTSVGQILMRMASRRDLGSFAKLAGTKAGAFAQMLDRDPISALKRVTQGLADMDRRFGAVATSRALDKLHLDGQRVRGTMLQLSRTIPLLDSYLATANSEWDSLAAIMEGAQIQGETLNAQFELLKTSLKLVAVEAGRGFLPVLKGAAIGVQNFARDVGNFVSSNGPMLEEWSRRARLTFEGIGTLWRQWPDHLEHAKVTVAEKLAQLLGIFANFGKQVGANLQWLASNIPAMLGNAIRAVGPKILPMIADIGKQMKDAIATGEVPSGLLGGAALAGGAVAGTRVGRGLAGGAMRLGGGLLRGAMALPGPLKVAGLAAAGIAAAPPVGRRLGGWAGRKMFGEAAPEWNPRLAGAPRPDAIPPAPGFSVRRLFDNLPNLNAEQAVTQDRIDAGSRVNRAKRFAANPPGWVGRVASVARNPTGALMGVAGLGLSAVQGRFGGMASPGFYTPGTRDYAEAMRRKQAAYGPRGGGVDLSRLGAAPMAPRDPAMAAADLLRSPAPSARTPSAAPGAGRGADTYAGRVWEANRARRGAVNAGFRQWRSSVNAMMRGESPMVGDGRRQAAKDPAEQMAERQKEANGFLKRIADALVGGAGSKGKPATVGAAQVG